MSVSVRAASASRTPIMPCELYGGGGGRMTVVARVRRYGMVAGSSSVVITAAAPASSTATMRTCSTCPAGTRRTRIQSAAKWRVR